LDLYAIPIDVLLLHVILYGCLPLWVILGFADYLCHRRSGIERTSGGVRESLSHCVMGAQIGGPVFLGLFFEINVLLLLLAFLLLAIHVWVAHHDVAYALQWRKVTLTEMHIHSFLETLPFVVVLLIILKRWPAFVDLITLNWAGNLTLVQKATPLDYAYIGGYFLFMLVVGIAPYLEELWRCYAADRKAGHATIRALR
jgi:hypothetical protein